MRSWEQRSDAELLRATPADPEAFATFYRRHVRAVIAQASMPLADRDPGLDGAGERELVAAAARQLRLRTARLARPRAGVAIPVAVVAVAVAVASAALLLPRSRQAQVGGRPSGHPAAVKHGAASTAPALIGSPALDKPLLRLLLRPSRPLTAVLAVLRRPQDAADRAMPALRPAPGHLVRSLTRQLTDLPGGERLYLAVLASPRANPTTLTIATTRLCLVAAGAGALNWTCAPALSQLLAPPWNYSPGPGELVELVPSGVVNVRWVFMPSTGAPGTIAVTPTLTGNVAHAPRSFAYGSPLSVTWHLAGGREVGVLSATLPRTILAGDGIGPIRFGASPARLRRSLSSLLGPPSLRYRSTRACHIDHVIRWPRLIAFFSKGRFVGYSYSPPRYRNQGPEGADQLDTLRGLSVGDTVALARRLYGAAFRLSAAQGGSWSVRTDRGRIDGFTTAVRSGRILSIEAGDVGCAAMTP